MKNIALIIASIIISLSLVNCGGSNQSDPNKVAVSFAQAYYAADFDKCNSFMDSDSRHSFTPEKEMSEFEKLAMKAIRKEAKKAKFKVKLNIEDSDIEATYAKIWLDITSDSDPDFESYGYVRVELKDGKWIVDSYSLPGLNL